MRLLSLLAICLLTLLAGPVRAQDEADPPPAPSTAAPDDSPGTSVTVNLSDPFIQSRLPFDVPFVFTGTVETDFTSLELHTYEVRSKDSVSAVTTAFRAAGRCDTPAEGGQPVGITRWEGTGTTFKVLVDALEPQRYYVFCFDLRGAVPAAAFAAEARTVVSTVFVPLASGEQADTVSVGMVQNIQDRLSKHIAAIGIKRAVPAVIPEGNLFHPARKVVQGDKFVGLMADVLDHAEEAGRRRREYDGRFDALEKLTQDLGEAGTFLSAEVVAALPTKRVVRLPDPKAALTDATPFDPAPYNFASVLESLDEAVRAARDAGNTGAEATIRSVEREVTRMQRFAQIFGRSYDALRLTADELIAEIALEARAIKVSLGSSVLSADLNRNAYVSLDAGIAYPWALETMAYYAGTNIYFRPINKNAPLRLKGSFSRRFAITIGVTTSVSDKSRRASDLRGSTDSSGESSRNSLLLGAGLRVTPSLRVGGGVLVFKESDINPLITQTSVAVTPYVSLAFDVNVGSLLGGMFPK